jgi:8-oxo-dGTP pyrophosphatase MutT (NUDIX family)
MWDRLDRQLIRRAVALAEPPQAAGELRRAAVAVVLAEGEPGVSLLLIRRAERASDPWSGHIALPGGHREPEDTDLLATALRETREELGLDLTAGGEYLGALGTFTPGRRADIEVSPFVFALDARPPLTPNHEVDVPLWVPLATLTPSALSAEYELVLAGQRQRFPAFRIGEHTVWGLTYRIVTTLLERVAASQANERSAGVSS